MVFVNDMIDLELLLGFERIVLACAKISDQRTDRGGEGWSFSRRDRVSPPHIPPHDQETVRLS